MKVWSSVSRVAYTSTVMRWLSPHRPISGLLDTLPLANGTVITLAVLAVGLPCSVPIDIVSGRLADEVDLKRLPDGVAWP